MMFSSFTTPRSLTMMMMTMMAAAGVWAQQEQQQASTVEIEGVTANFEQSQIIPNLLSSLSPQALLNVAYGGQMISLGQALDQGSVGSQPNLTVTPAGDVSTDATYTVALVDADVVGTDDVANNVTRHWLVNNVKLSGSAAPYALEYTTAAITNYAGPGPASGSGAHRYCLFLISQPSSFTAPAYLSQPDTPLGTYNFSAYLGETGLGGIVAASYFTVENGQATAQVSSTSAVVSSTLATSAAASSSSSSSGSMMTSASSSMTKASSSSSSSAAAAATSSTSGAASSLGKPAVGVAVAVSVAGALLAGVAGVASVF